MFIDKGRGGGTIRRPYKSQHHMNNDKPNFSLLIGALILFVLMLLGSFTASSQAQYEPVPTVDVNAPTVYHVKILSRETNGKLDDVERLHKEINTCAAITIAGGVGGAIFPPAIAVSGVAVIVRFFKVNKHRRLTNELLRKGVS